MGKRFTSERRRELAELLLSNGSVQISRLAEQFQVSRETIRKDLLFLESEGIGQKTRGGSLIAEPAAERPLSSRAAEHTESKARIARAAAAKIPDGATVLMDAGSTTCEIAKLLVLRHHLTVVTNSALIPPILAGSDNTVYALGGELRGSSLACVGMWTLSALQSIRGDLAILATDGCLNRGGPCTTVYAEAEVKKAMVRNAGRTMLVCDSSKFLQESIVQFCSWDEIDLLLTDDKADPEQIEPLRAKMEIELL